MNSRPTVYETSAVTSDLVEIARLKARARALEALEGLGRGEGQLAASILAELAIAGDAEARAALAEIAGGRWSLSVDVIAALAQEERDAPGRLDGWMSGRSA